MSTAKSAQTSTSVRHKSKSTSAKPATGSAPKSKLAAASSTAAPSTERRTAYKPVLDNPLMVDWPKPPAAARQEILDVLCQLLNTYNQQSVSTWRHNHHAARHREARQQAAQSPKNGGETSGTHKRKAAAVDDRTSKKRKLSKAVRTSASRPSILEGMTVGINDTTRTLEQVVRQGRAQLGHAPMLVASKLAHDKLSKKLPTSNRRRVRSQLPHAKSAGRNPFQPTWDRSLSQNFDLSPEKYLQDCMSAEDSERRLEQSHFENPPQLAFANEDSSWKCQIDLVFVCKPDINPPTLVGHLPTAVAAVNGVRAALDAQDQETFKDAKMDVDGRDCGSRPPLYLVPLDIGAERKLSDALGLRRVAVVGLSSCMPGLESLLEVVQRHIEPIRAPWLVPFLSSNKQHSPQELPKLVPTHVKHLKTSVPLDLKAAHAAKKERKQLKKQGVYVAED
ncbi:hypothetical protein ACM66B_000823 [Microbotryomycetes sp. NB124-2]